MRGSKGRVGHSSCLAELWAHTVWQQGEVLFSLLMAQWPTPG